MKGTIGPDAAHAAVALHSSHPSVPALNIFTVDRRQCAGCVTDFGLAVKAGEPFALLIADAFDKGMTRDEWLWVKNPVADPQRIAAWRQVWQTDVPSRLAAN